MDCDEKVKEYEMSLFEIIGKTLFYMFHRLLLPIFPCIFLFSKGAAMSANDILYALKYSNDIKLVPSAELVDKFPEALVSFLESHTQFNWSESPSADNIETSNTLGTFISACTNQGGQGFKYLLSRVGNEFFRVVPSRTMVKHAADVVVRFLESKLDFNDCDPLATIGTIGKSVIS